MELRIISPVIVAMLALAGCFTGSDDDSPTVALPPETPVFSEPLLIDAVRAGGEPVIAITQAGTILVSAHPGWTHYHPSEDPTHVGTELLTPASGQSYLWRSTDGGASWTHIGAPGQEEGPRGTALGVSDPEFTVMEDGTICYTDLEALASSSVACSTDDGETWLVGNPVAAGRPNDRQWLASSGDELYFTANYFADHNIRASTDRGLTWEERGDVPCEQDIVADPHSGHLIGACNAGVTVSEDGGRTWTAEDERQVLDAGAGGQRIMAEPAVDGAGNVWVTYTQGEGALWVAGSPDQGKSWPWVYDLTPRFAAFARDLEGCQESPDARLCVGADHRPADRDGTGGEAGSGDAGGTGGDGLTGTYVWPWISAGSGGRVAVTWIGAFPAAASATYDGDWYIFSIYLLDGTSDRPTFIVNQLTPEPMHRGPICQEGTLCQVSSMQGDDAGDRRLGDFFETTIDADGFLHGSWSNTRELPEDVISHPQYVRQTGGVRLLADEDIGVWMPTQG